MSLLLLQAVYLLVKTEELLMIENRFCPRKVHFILGWRGLIVNDVIGEVWAGERSLNWEGKIRWQISYSVYHTAR